jgi:trans-2,3-dihydro-3-hydroxyanthranilate isomerase
MRRRLVTLDVFTDRRFAGNPLAVVLDPDGLERDAMQAVAREFNYPETVFTFAPGDPTHRARVCIFTPAQELPFAGHPTVGTAVLLGLRDGATAGREFVLEEGVGPVRCVLESNGGERGRARFTVPQLPAEVGPAPDAAMIAAALGLRPADIGFDGWHPACWSAGIPIFFVPLAGLGAVGACRADSDQLASAFGDRAIVYVFCAETIESGHAFHARMFAPGLGVPEDPATGSAAAAFAGLLAARGRLADGDHAISIEQGYEMGRPSLIGLAIAMRAGKLASASIGGDAVIVSEGTIEE